MSDHEDGLGDHPEHPGQEAEAELGYYARRAQAMEALLVEKGICTREEVQRQVDERESISPADGARVVARAWVNADFKARLLQNATEAVREMGFIGAQTTDVVAVENSAQVHNVVVCTLCSCYPWALLGLPPPWYKSYPYRARVVREPRDVLKEFGVELGEDVEVREPKTETGAPIDTHWVVACPLHRDGVVYGGVAVEVEGLDTAQVPVVTQLMKWGSAWPALPKTC